MNERVWKTKDGRKVRVCDMDDAHLINTIRYMDRRLEAMKWEMEYPNFPNPREQEIAVRRFNDFMTAKPEYVWSFYLDMKVEAAKRGLDPSKTVGIIEKDNEADKRIIDFTKTGDYHG